MAVGAWGSCETEFRSRSWFGSCVPPPLPNYNLHYTSASAREYRASAIQRSYNNLHIWGLWSSTRLAHYNMHNISSHYIWSPAISGAVHLLRNTNLGSWKTPPILIIWAYPPKNAYSRHFSKVTTHRVIMAPHRNTWKLWNADLFCQLKLKKGLLWPSIFLKKL